MSNIKSSDSDRCLTQAIDAFVARASAGDIRVECKDGVATLHGTVRSHSARTALEDLVLAHEGVRSVDNLLMVETSTAASARQFS